MDDTRKYRFSMSNILPLRKRLEAVGKQTSIRLGVMEQDYLLSWVLAGIYQHPLLKNSLVFKGGTALKKCYFGEYRFSEDIDFTATAAAPAGSKLLSAVIEACEYAQKRMNEYAPVTIKTERYLEKYPHPHGQEAFAVYGQFPWQREPLSKVMIEVTRDECLLIGPKSKPILHEYGEPINQEITVYALEEIILEKLRAILQHTEKLHERDSTRSRARDYYDLWRILGTFGDQLNLKLVRVLLP
jgi:predicted nucleotidyltransferase component of viral defense system